MKTINTNQEGYKNENISRNRKVKKGEKIEM